MIIYFDELLLLNFVLNSLILFFTAWVSGAPFLPVRAFGAALLGSVYSLGEVLPQLALLYEPLSKLVLSFLLVHIAFVCQTWRQMTRMLLIFWCTSFVFGGAILGWHFFWQSSFFWTEAQPFEFTLSQIIGGGVIGGSCILIWSKGFLQQFRHEKLYFPVTICYGENSIVLKGYLDTGNALYTLADHRPVLIVESGALREFLPASLLDGLRKRPEEIFSDISQQNMAIANRLELVYCQGIVKTE
ncbi:MAG: sigma-E processing peptidase SpoIIGA, partial [Sporomusaceae bacterium]|nr:sigma-E processing peptidase SpoIIGA [Sporomusaceae bacterium]